MARKTATDPLEQIFAAWRLWLLGAFVGALLAWGLYQLSPPAYRAQATVVVDQNLEEAWQYFPDRDLFHFMSRETLRLEQLAWSDAVLQTVADEVPGYSVSQLRSETLTLSHPSDGGWHFYARAAEAADAQFLASAWAQAFVAAVREAVVASPELEAARAEVSREVLSGEPNASRLFQLLGEMDFLAEHSQGISLYTELYLAQAADLPVERSVSQGTYLFAGSLIGALAAPLYVLLQPAKPRRR